MNPALCGSGSPTPPLQLVHAVDPNRRVLINQERLDVGYVDHVSREVFGLNQKPGDILVIINSLGGSHSAGKHIGDIFRTSSSRIIGKVEGKADSAAFTALMGCHLRFATENSTFLVHNPEFDWSLRVKHNSSAEIVGKNFLTIRKNVRKERLWLIHAILNREGVTISRKELIALLKSERRISALEALHFGFIDGVL